MRRTTQTTPDPTPPADPALTSKFRLEELIGTGGQAHVWRGVQIGLGRPVAIKILRTAVVDRVFARHARRFEQEARLLSQLHDPHTITLHDFGTLSGGAMFMVFEFVDGVNLSDLLATEGRLAPGRVAKIMRQVLSSLQEAHAMGVLHRDLKPSNIMLYERSGRRDLVKLLDFGIAKILGHDASPITAEGQILGTPRYIPPEAVGDLPYTASSDLYSLGLVAYELLVGDPAVPGSTTREIIDGVLNAPAVTLPDSCGVPAALRSIIERMVRRDPAERYQSADHALSDLQRWHEHAPLCTRHDDAPPPSHTPGVLDSDPAAHRLTAPLPHVQDSAPPSLTDSEPEEIPTALVDALQPQQITTAKLNALDLSRDSGPTLPLAPIRGPLTPSGEKRPAPALEVAGGTRPMFIASNAPPEPAAKPAPEPEHIDAADAHDLLFSDPGASPDDADETPSRSPSSISGEGLTVGGSTERFPNMVHRTVGAPKIDPSLRVDREPKQRPAITPSKLERPAHLAPSAGKPRVDTVQVDYIPPSAPVTPSKRTPWEALGVSGPVFAFAVALLLVMFMAIAAVIALARM